MRKFIDVFTKESCVTWKFGCNRITEDHLIYNNTFHHQEECKNHPFYSHNNDKSFDKFEGWDMYVLLFGKFFHEVLANIHFLLKFMKKLIITYVQSKLFPFLSIHILQFNLFVVIIISPFIKKWTLNLI